MSEELVISSDALALTALVTGASSGIGLEFCRQLAEQGINVILVSNQVTELAAARDSLAERHPNLRFWSYYKDLSEADAAQELYDYCRSNGITVDILINNAGIFNFKETLSMTPERINIFIDLHMRTLTMLCYLFGGDMKRRKSGFILNMSSMSCWAPMPGLSMYSSTKAYIRVFSRSLYYELIEDGVGVTVACPGGIATDLFGLPENLKKLALALRAISTPQAFVKCALKHMFNRDKQFVDGWLNKLAIIMVYFTPTWIRLIVKHKLLNKNVTR